MTANVVTAVVLTKNEVENLDRCLGSLRWCAEIVVIDSGSTDGTQGKATSLGARVLEHPMQPFIMADQRNWAIEHAGIRSPWVLFLDADETVPQNLAEELLRVCGAETCAFDAFELTPRYLFWGVWLKRTQGYPNWHPRLVRSQGVRYAGGVWDHFAQGTKVGRIHLPYDHFANSKGFSDWLGRHDRYSTWDAARIVEFLGSGKAESLGTARKQQLRIWAAKFWPLRPWGRFFQMYFLRLGFLEGRTAFVFCLLYFFYEWMTVVKTVELLRRARKLPL